MRYVLAGKGRAAVSCLGLLAKADADEVLAMAVRSDDGEDGWQPSLVKAAQDAGVDWCRPERIGSPEALETVREFGPDFLISVQYDQIFRPAMLGLPRIAALNLHFALLPRHQGVAPVAWALLENDSEAGVTLHRMVPEIDAGAVVRQSSMPIRDDSTARELYDGLTDLAIQLFADVYPLSERVVSLARPQQLEQGCYHRNGDFDFTNVTLDWSRPARELHNWTRAMIFPPFQYPETRIHGRTVQIRRVSGVADTPPGAPGTVVDVDREGVLIATGNGGLRITDVADPTDPALTSSSIISTLQPGVRVG